MKIIVSKLLKIFVFLLILTTIVFDFLFVRHFIIKIKINDDITNVYNNEKYAESILMNDFKVIEQKITCGYAIIEVLSNHQGGDATEQSLYSDNNNTISTSVWNGFRDEMNKQFPNFTTRKIKHLKNTELIDNIYEFEK